MGRIMMSPEPQDSDELMGGAATDLWGSFSPPFLLCLGPMSLFLSVS